MKIETIMTKDIVVASVKDDIKTLSALMKKYDIGFLPLSKKNKIVGVITDRDLALACSNQVNYSSTLESYCTKQIITIDRSDTILNALKQMGNYKIKRLLVLDNKKVVGILSLSDIVNHVEEKEILATFKKIWQVNRNKHTFHTEIDEFYL